MVRINSVSHTTGIHLYLAGQLAHADHPLIGIFLGD
ncbi:hypothetical protein N6B35_28715 (plasmid) [Klebsiella michiganensis]|nr:hypothetical protein N6B35_28715 [Klebsiella michiganensis]